jgi:hypothetical protein
MILISNKYMKQMDGFKYLKKGILHTINGRCLVVSIRTKCNTPWSR